MSSTETQTRMHVSLNAKDIERSTAFYAAFFGHAPTKTRGDYAKFTLDEPGLVLSLNAAPAVGPRSVLSHLGFQVPTDDALEKARARVVAAGLEVSLDEPGVTCCYAVQNKFWVTDPDGNAWEIYRFLEDAEVFSDQVAERGSAATSASGCCPGEVACADTAC